MAFLNPLVLLLAAVFGPLVILLHLLRQRRAPAPVSSTFLWRRVIRDVTANAPWQRLRRTLLFILQMLIVLCFLFALARPFRWSGGISGRDLIVLLDVSPSMAAEHDGVTRLASAVTAAARAIRQLPDSGRTTLIIAGSRLRVPIAASADRAALLAELQRITIDFAARSDLRAGLSLAAALAEQQPSSEILILSDGNADIRSDRRLPVPVVYQPIGSSVANSAISAIDLLPTATGQLLTMQIVQYGGAVAERRLLLRLDGVLSDAFDLQLTPGIPQTVTRDIPSDVQRVDVAFEDADAFVLDDQARALRTEREAVRVRLVTDQNRFLTTALQLLPGVDVQLTDPLDAMTEPVQLTILDGTIPDRLPSGNLFFLRPPSSTEWFDVVGRSQSPQLRAIAAEDSLLRGVNLRDISIQRSTVIRPGNWATTVIDSDTGPLLLVGEEGGRRIAVLAFDLHESDLPLTVAFPILLSNLVNYLAPGVANQNLSVNSGAAIPWIAAENPSSFSIRAEDGTLITEAALTGPSLPSVTAAAPGWYRAEIVRRDGTRWETPFAVNFSQAHESELLVAEQLTLPQAGGLAEPDALPRARQDLTVIPIAIALTLLLLEWLIFYADRRSTSAPADDPVRSKTAYRN